MASLSEWLPYAEAAATVVNATDQVKEAKSRQQDMFRQARAIKDASNAAAAESQREAAIERRKAKNLVSRARAVAASSGAGATDPTVSNILTDIETQGEMNALNTLYSGSTLSRGLQNYSSAMNREGRSTKRAGYRNAAASILTGGTSWYEKYGA